MSPAVSDNTYDIIFAGGGTAACVTAGRLASADPSLKILIIEAGPHTQELLNHLQPARYLDNFRAADPPFNFHVSKPSAALDGRSVVIGVGKCLGGGSSVNLVMYTRVSASDYDDWELVHKNPGWGSKDLIPLLKKAETYQPGDESKNPSHGFSGPLKISYRDQNISTAEQFLDMARGYDKERGIADDVNDFVTCNKYGMWPKYVDATTGKRSDVPHHYIYNLDNKNLKIEVKSHVKRVLFEGDRAAGVEYLDDKAEVRVAHASRLVVVASGPFGSPAVLERSGIGAATILKTHGIEQIVDLPGVGENYHDHDGLTPSYFASDDAETLDVIYRGDVAEMQPHIDEWTKTGKGLLTHNGFDAGIKIRPNADDLKAIGPSFEKRWQSHFANAPDRGIAWIGLIAGNLGADPTALPRKYYAIGYYAQYPDSTGSVHITSAQDPKAPIDFDAPFLKAESDVRVVRWVYKKSREFARRMGVYRGEDAARHPAFPAGSAAAVVAAADGPVAFSAPDIIYSSEDDDIIDDFHRKNISTSWHSLGTCAMKPREKGGVVDSKLNVYGVRNLKVADLSIAPDNVGGNTANTAIGIGERAAMIIAEELGIKGV